MKPPPFVYHDPTTVDEATDLIGRLDNALPLAGGQSLMPMLNFRVVTPDHLIDINRITALSYISIADGRGRFGAMTRQRDLEFSSEVSGTFPIIHEALAHVGHRQTRNRGTFGGSLCHLDPSAELVNLAALHDGVLEAASRGGSRRIAIADWASGIMTHALDPGELLTAIELRAWPQGHGYAFEEFSAAERLLNGETPSHEAFRAAAVEAESLDAAGDIYVSATYRKHLARVLTYRAIERAVARSRGRRAA